MILTAAGALIAVGVVEGKGMQYRGTIQVRSATADASCVYFNCQQPVSTVQGNPYVLDQVNAILSPALASQVAHRLPGLTTAKLLAHVCAKEVGQSSTIDVCYTAPSKHDAETIAATYGKAYVDWSNSNAVNQLGALSTSLTNVFKSLTLGQKSGNRGQTLQSDITAVETAKAAFAATPGNGPNGAKIFGTDPSAQVITVRSTPSPAKAGAIGAAAGLVLAIGLLLILPPLIRRPGSGEQDDRDSGSAGSEESLDLFTAPVDEPVR